MKKTIFLLGGSALQVDLLRKAKERYHVIVVDGNLDCTLRSEADEFVHLDFSDTGGLYQLALVKPPSLILTMASEPGNLSAAIVSAKLGLKYNPAETVFKTINKIAMKKVLPDSCMPTASYRPVMGDEQAFDSIEGQSWPLVVKPSQSSAGRGVKLVNNVDDLVASVAEAKAISKDGCALVEQFIAGDQYSVETISCNGHHYVIGITREFFGPPPFFAETQQMFPADLAPADESRIRMLALEALDAFGIEYGACHIELRVTPRSQLYIIEIASRMGGWRSELIRAAHGIEYADLLLRAYEDDEVVIAKTKDKCCLVKMIFSETDLERERALRKEPIYEISPVTWLKKSIGQTQSSLMDSAGYYYVEANSFKDAFSAL